MKKKIITLALVGVLGVTAVIGASLAYFTDTASKSAEFTVGEVDIELTLATDGVTVEETTTEYTVSDPYLVSYEELGGTDVVTTVDAAEEFRVANGFATKNSEPGYGWYFTGTVTTTTEVEGQVEIAADELLAELLVPGQTVAFYQYVENIGTVDAYVRIIISMDEAIGVDVLAIDVDAVEALGYSVYVVDGVYTFTYLTALAPGEIAPSPLSSIGMATTVTQEDVTAFSASFDVDADAIQAETFADAAEAFAAYDAQ